MQTEPTSSVYPHPRPWLAGVLSLLGAGVGHFYAGARLRAWIIAVALSSFGLALRSLAARGPLYVYLGTILALGVTVWAIWDAMRIARDAPQFTRPAIRRWTEWAIFVALIGLGYEAAKMLVQSQGWVPATQSYSIPSNSMAPTILMGEHVMVDLNAYALKPIQRGDVVVFEHPGQEGVFMLKRVIGISGDKIEMRKRSLFINGKAVLNKKTGEKPEEFARDGSEIHEETIDGKKIRIFYSNNPLQDHFKAEVPEGSVYLLGDNRDFSHDSRFWGPVSEAAVRGKALFTYFRLNLESGNPRLSLWGRWIK